MEWNEPVLAQYELQFGIPKQTVVARLGFPRFISADDEWACSFQLDGVGENRIQVAHSIEGIHALMIAATALRKALDTLTAEKPNDISYEIAFPRFVPISYGVDFHRRLCRMLDEEIEKKEKELTKRRLARGAQDPQS